MRQQKAIIGLFFIIGLFILPAIASAGNIEEAQRWYDRAQIDITFASIMDMQNALYYQNMEIISLLQEQNALIKEQINFTKSSFSYPENILESSYPTISYDGLVYHMNYRGEDFVSMDGGVNWYHEYETGFVR